MTKFKPELFSDEETLAMSLCLSFTCCLYFCFKFDVLSFSRGNVLDFGHQSFVWYPQPACSREKTMVLFYILLLIVNKLHGRTKNQQCVFLTFGDSMCNNILSSKVHITIFFLELSTMSLSLLQQMELAQVSSELLSQRQLVPTEGVNL